MDIVTPQPRPAQRPGTRPVTDFFQRTLDSMLAHIAILRLDGTILAVNAAWNAFATQHGLFESRCGPGVNYLDVCERATDACSKEADAVASGIRDVASRRLSTFQREYPCHTPTERRWFLVRVTRFDADGNSYLVVAHDNITQRKRAELKLRRANRLLAEQAVREWRRHRRLGIPLSILFIDVDHFKKYNDAHGHLAGDDCLRTVARILQQAITVPGGLVARYGGEEFAAILPDTDRAGGLELAQKVVSAVRGARLPHEAPEAGPFITVSVGTATAEPNAGLSLAHLLTRTDQALYRAKTAGRDRAAD
jgi:diguanylate cyclase (GGDEF)-like protein